MSGDPLCPYIFILCVEELFMLIKDVEKKAKVHEVKICMDALVVSHLVFADDSVLFFRDDEREVVVVRKILDEGLKNDVISLLGVTRGNGGGKHLGLPSSVGRSKKAIF